MEIEKEYQRIGQEIINIYESRLKELELMIEEKVIQSQSWRSLLRRKLLKSEMTAWQEIWKLEKEKNETEKS